ncbi:MAG TPA: glutathione S-transferase family protein [Casimicrobiaceae bacterium]|nr:glutathione S-transferase family protein [Casimicrobiaceae bacterium]
MPLILYYGSGSPFAWKVQLALEHKALPYERRVLSFSAGDTRKPEFLALNPRHRVPVIDDDGFVLYESNAIVEYLDEQYPGRGAPLFPGDARERALVRRLVCEVDNYVEEAVDLLTEPLFYKKPEERDPAAIAKGRDAVTEEFRTFTRAMRGPFLAGPLSAADFAFYPLVAFLYRAQQVKMPELDVDGMLTPELRAWKARVEALPYLASTIPPHWQKG